MKTKERRTGRRQARPVLLIPIVFVLMALYGDFVRPNFPGLDTWYFQARVAGAVGAAAGWIVAR